MSSWGDLLRLQVQPFYIVDRLSNERRRIADALAGEPVVVEVYDDAEQFLNQVTVNASGCVLAPLDLPGTGLRALIEEIKHRHLPLAVVVLGRDSEGLRLSSS